MYLIFQAVMFFIIFYDYDVISYWNYLYDFFIFGLHQVIGCRNKEKQRSNIKLLPQTNSMAVDGIGEDYKVQT